MLGLSDNQGSVVVDLILDTLGKDAVIFDLAKGLVFAQRYGTVLGIAWGLFVLRMAVSEVLEVVVSVLA